ncbi:carbohydrate-binding protein [Achlya hypogyna]|uniref:Carbohydrate-binding protein n=1 Tax=Achlya hypogyna TaxID=1202772 RepID=A0A0A7CN57_ACHHY|nr:secreted protein [Achlya hypogyna]OQR94062.1 carbohydrate-binding protein [Achlya hypogyna]
MGNHISHSIATVAILTCTVVGDTYDVIVIGSGPGGLVASEFLSRNASLSVLVLEAGGPSLQASGGTDVPGYAAVQGLTRFDIPGEYSNVAFQSDNKYRMNTDWIASPANLWLGKVVGGSSSLNGMLYFQTPDSYVTEASWPYNAASVAAGYTAIEQTFSYTNNPSPDGQRYLQEAYTIVGSALAAGGYKESAALNSDRNAKSKSFGHPPFAIKDGLRNSPAKTFLGAAKGRSNFKLITGATVQYIVQSKGQASGVVYQQNGNTITVNLSARGAVVVAGSAVMTPKILMQSGVGPKSQLQLLANTGAFPGVSKDASTWAVNENVGNSLFDTHQLLMTFSRSDMKTFLHSQSPSAAIQQYMTSGHSGPWASPDPVLMAYENYNINGRDYQFQVTTFCHGFNGGTQNDLGVAVYVNNPVSRDAARFTPDGKYHLDTSRSMYNDQRDTTAMANFVDKLRSMLSKQGVREVGPSATLSSLNLVQSRVEGANHYGGSCYTSGDGSDSSRCADETFRVVGTKNIFVGDGSLMKTGTVNPYGFIMYAGYQTGVNVAKAVGSYSSVTPPPATCTAYENDVDYYGNDVGSTQRASADFCCSDCVAQSGCTVYVWNSHNGGTCWLKSKRGTKSALPGAKSASVGSATPTPPPAPGSCSAFENDVDYYGNDVGSTQRSSADSCCADCAAKPGCTLYVWNSHNGGTCWLKSKRGAKSTLLGARSGSLGTTTPTSTPVTPSPTPSPTTSPTPAPGSCSSFENDVDYYGNDVGSTQRANAKFCCADCAAKPGCTLYVWNSHNGGTCWLKSKRGTKSTLPGAKSGAIAATNPICGIPEPATDFTGQDVANVPGSSPGDCCTACQNNKACNAWSLWNNVCWLKSGHNGRKAAPGTIAGIVNKCSILEVGVDYVGNDIAQAAAVVADDCCAICRNTNGCGAFSWYQGMCYMKSSKGATKANGGVISASVVQ